MKTFVLATFVLLMGGSSFALAAAVPSLDIEPGVSAPAPIGLLVLASNDDNGGDDNGGDDNGGSGGDDNGADDNDDDDNGGSGNVNDDDNDDDEDRGDDRPRASDDDKVLSGSNRRKVRVPGGSGCDEPGDIIEHPECGTANQ